MLKWSSCWLTNVIRCLGNLNGTILLQPFSLLLTFSIFFQPVKPLFSQPVKPLFFHFSFWLDHCHYFPYTDTRMTTMSMCSWWIFLPCQKLVYLLGSVYHNTKQARLRFSEIKAFFEKITLYSYWESRRSAGAPSMVTSANTDVNLQTLLGGSGCAS